MKKLLALAVLALTAAAAMGEGTDKKEELRYNPDPNPAFCIARGFTNLASGWLEIPRCIIYDNTETPFLGWFTGLGSGIGLTVARVLDGVYDIVSFGSSGASLHSDKFPDLVFEAIWVPKTE